MDLIAKPLKLIESFNDVKDLPLEEHTEAKLCVRRFFYSSIFSKFSTYHQDFHFSFLLGNIVKLEASRGKGDLEIIELLKGIYPPFSKARMKFIIEENKPYVQKFISNGLRDRVYKNVEYKEYAGYFQFLTHRAGFDDENWKQAFKFTANVNFFESQEFRDKIAQEMPESTPGYICRFCPHNSYCKDAMYPVDFKRE